MHLSLTCIFRYLCPSTSPASSAKRRLIKEIVTAISNQSFHWNGNIPNYTRIRTKVAFQVSAYSAVIVAAASIDVSRYLRYIYNEDVNLSLNNLFFSKTFRIAARSYELVWTYLQHWAPRLRSPSLSK